MNKPEITVNDRGITFETDAFRMNIEFNDPDERTSRLVEKFEAFKQSIQEPHLRGAGEPVPSVREGGGAKAKTGMKICAKCGVEFKPSGNAQRYCSPQCGMRTKWVPKPDAPAKSPDDLDKTLSEIEAERKKPYEFK